MDLEDQAVTVKVSRELLPELNDWSPPVQVRVDRIGDDYDLIARTHQCAEPGRFLVYAPPYRSGGNIVLGIHHDGCPAHWWDEVEDFTDLAELVQRAGEHAEVCR